MPVFYIVGTMALWQLFYKDFGDNLEEYHEILAMPMSSEYEKKEFPQDPPGRRPRRYLQLDRQTIYTERWDLSILLAENT